MKLDIKKNFEFNKIKINQLSSTWLNTLANHINLSIQEGLKTSTDIDGNAFAPVSNFTKKSIQDGDSHKRPLVRSGRMKETRVLRPTPKKLSFKITSGFKKSKARWNLVVDDKKYSGTRKSRGYNYGAFHQPAAGKGFQMINYTSKDSLIPDKRVPIRKWFGIPKPMLPNGARWFKFAKQFDSTFQRFLTTAMKSFRK